MILLYNTTPAIAKHIPIPSRIRGLLVTILNFGSKWSAVIGIAFEADGQHLVKNILNVCLEIKNKDHIIVLGVRRFVGKVPWKSAIGNAFARRIFTLTSGAKLLDTQTGLRGFSIESLPWLLYIDGERYEYEMNMLLSAKKAGYGFKQIEIDTVYEASNKSSHFRAVKDSIRVFMPFLKFCGSGISAGIVDYFLLFYLHLIMFMPGLWMIKAKSML